MNPRQITSAAICALGLCAAARAQIVVNQARIRNFLPGFEDQAAGPALRCAMSPIQPQLNFSFRYQAGYTVTVPMSQYAGGGHRWAMITRITPEGHPPVYLISRYGLPDVPQTKGELQVGGGYLLGEGAYRVRQLLVDEGGRACRKDWRVEVRRSRAESKVKVNMPAGAVWDVSLRGSRMLPANPDDAAPVRISVLLHAAPMFPRRTRLRQNDVMTLLASLSSVLERVPARNVRLAAFNLDQQKELYRRDDFRLANIPEVAETLQRTEIGTVDLKVLQNKRGHIETLAELVNQEMHSESPPDVVLFLGPVSRYFDNVPHALLERGDGRGPQVWFFELRPVFRGGPPGMLAEAALPDSIAYTVSRLGGKSLVIRSPGDLAKAIDRLEKTGAVGTVGDSVH
jgi:hypothetical protein